MTFRHVPKSFPLPMLINVQPTVLIRESLFIAFRCGVDALASPILQQIGNKASLHKHSSDLEHYESYWTTRNQRQALTNEWA